MMQDQGATTGSGMTGGSQSSYGASSTSPNATVAAIEVMPRSSSAATEGDTSASAAMGSSSGGTTGSSPDRVYRVTLRMDDGSTQVVTQQTTPDFRTGDRVSLTGGVIQH
jgi:outer membrane lipoprotein SlyB